MSTHKYIDRLCALALALTLAVTALFMGGEALGLQPAAGGLGYEERLFDAGRVHTLDIIMDGWEDFLSGCEDKEYAACTLVIDGETCRNVAIRAKGNSSLSTVSSYGNNRYSFKVEFDHYDDANTYYGLDKLSLNNLIQDNTLMKDFLCYQLMGAFGVAAPLCSYVSITVNGELWGLYLAVEGVEDAFLRRNYGTDAGELYKPDSLSFGGDRGGSFDPEDLAGDFDPADFAGNFDPAAFDDGGAPPFEDPPQRPGGIVNGLVDRRLRAAGLESAEGQVVVPGDHGQPAVLLVEVVVVDHAAGVAVPVADKAVDHKVAQDLVRVHGPGGLLPTLFCTYEEFEQGVEALRTFCALRAESIRGQLAGTVPSTSQGQAEHSAGLVDASGLALSAMGSMSGDGGGPGGLQPRQDAAEVFARGRPEGSRRPGEESPQGEDGTGLTMLAGSAALLAAGLVLAVTFRRRG